MNSNERNDSDSRNDLSRKDLSGVSVEKGSDLWGGSSTTDLGLASASGAISEGQTRASATAAS